VKLYVREAGSDETKDRLAGARMAATSRVAYPEARAALARRRREGAISASALVRAVRALDRDLGRLGDLTEQRALRGFDAIHLASALEIQDLTGTTVAFCCFDDRLGAAATAEGLSTA